MIKVTDQGIDLEYFCFNKIQKIIKKNIMTTILTKTAGLLPNIITDLTDAERYSNKGILNMEGDFIPYESLLKIPYVNVWETETDYQIDLAAPGLDKKDFRVELANNVLYISAEKEVRTEKSIGGISHKEFSFDNFCRTFRLPENSKVEKVQAHYENGILKVEIPKKEIALIKPKKEFAVA